MTTALPSQPFVNEAFSLDGGGIDFLGMRLVSLHILQDDLIPGINNATADFGVYCLATWMAWKFQRLCESQKHRFMKTEFEKFEEKVSVAIAHAIRPESEATRKFGQVNRGIGVQQKLQLPAELSFSGIKRTRSTSIYAAPLYGPTLGYLDLLSYAQAEDLSATDVRMAHDDPDTTTIANFVESSLQSSSCYEKIGSLDSPTFTELEIDDLGLHGLHTSYYRNAPSDVRSAFERKLLPTDDPNGRTFTAELIIETLTQCPNITLDQVRAIWHTGKLPTGEALDISRNLQSQRQYWAVFQGRQYQRYCVETFLKCFEQALLDGNTSIDEIVSATLAQFDNEKMGGISVRELILNEIRQLDTSLDIDSGAKHWAAVVHPGHDLYIERIRGVDEETTDAQKAVSSMIRWWIRANDWFQWDSCEEHLVDGGEARIGIRWFHDWVRRRLDLPLRDFLHQLFEQAIFAQHLRIALSRFDGSNQRLRFILDDRGIVPTRSARSSLTKQIPGWTADRLEAFCCLLCDLGKLKEDDGQFRTNS